MRKARVALRWVVAVCALLGGAFVPMPAGAHLPTDPTETGVSAPFSPPATYYGQERPRPGFVPAAGMPVSAWIGGRLCGQSSSLENGGQIVYAVDVVGEGPGGVAGCGAPGRGVTFQVGTQFMAPTAWWDNSLIHDLPLEPMRPPVEPSVSILRSGDSLALEWPQVALDTNGNATLVMYYRIWQGTKPYFDPDIAPCECVHIADVAGLSYPVSDNGAVDVVGDVSTDYSYMLRAFNAVGVSAVNKRVGEFDFALVPGSQ